MCEEDARKQFGNVSIIEKKSKTQLSKKIYLENHSCLKLTFTSRECSTEIVSIKSGGKQTTLTSEVPVDYDHSDQYADGVHDERE